MTILEEIIDHKKIEVAERKKNVPVSQLEKFDFFAKECESLKERLLNKDATGVIAEFKRRSPSRGTINDQADVFTVLRAYDMHMASGISVLTDEKYFGGSLADIYDHRASISAPILRKDFIIDEYQVIESKAIGADVILLIAACLRPSEVKRLANFAKSLGLDVLLELHDESELGHICEDTELIGINNRNLNNFEVNMERSVGMAGKIPGGRIRIAESGIHSVDQLLIFKERGFQGFLIGELFMKYPDPSVAFYEFVKELAQKRVSG